MEYQTGDGAAEQQMFDAATKSARVHLSVSCPVCSTSYTTQNPCDSAAVSGASAGLIAEAIGAGWRPVMVGAVSAFLCSDSCTEQWFAKGFYTIEPRSYGYDSTDLPYDQGPITGLEKIESAVEQLRGKWFRRKDILDILSELPTYTDPNRVTNTLRKMTYSGRLIRVGDKSFTQYRWDGDDIGDPPTGEQAPGTAGTDPADGTPSDPGCQAADADYEDAAPSGQNQKPIERPWCTCPNPKQGMFDRECQVHADIFAPADQQLG